MGKVFKPSDFIDAPNAKPTAKTFSRADFADDGEALPSYANGLAPEVAINESPVSFEDRAKLSVGNTKGKLEFLQKNYGETQLTKSGDFVVKAKDGLWRRVDPEGLGDGDAWKATKDLLTKVELTGPFKELAADVTEMVPTAVNIGTQIGAAALMTPATAATGGVGLPAQIAVSGAIGGALNAAETSLGRLVGTYSGSVEDQAKDAAIETVMSLGGTAIAAGVKPTAKAIASGLSTAAKKIGVEGPVIKTGLSNIIGLSVKGGAKSPERLFERPDQVANWMKVAAEGGRSADDAINFLKVNNVMDTKDIAASVRPALTEFYERGANEVIESVDNKFAVNFKEDVKPMMDLFLSKGMAQADELKGTIKLKPFEQYVKDSQAAGVVSDMINDKKSYELLSDMFNEIKKYEGFGLQKGQIAAKNLMNFRRNIFDKSFELQATADDLGLVPAQRLLAGLKGIGDQAVYSKFKLAQPKTSALLGETDNLFSALNKRYADLSNQFKPLLRTVKQAEANGDVAYENLYNKLSSAGGRNSVLKTEFDKAVDLVAQYSKTGKNLAEKFEAIKDRDASMAFLPNLKPGLISSISVPAAAASAATGNLGVAIPMAATAAMTSPKANYKVVRGLLKASALVKSLKPQDRTALLATPQAFNALYGTVLEAPAVQNQITSQLMQQGVKAIKGEGSQ